MERASDASVERSRMRGTSQATIAAYAASQMSSGAVRRRSAAQNSASALSHCTATYTAASLRCMIESRIAEPVCISLLATRPGKVVLEKAEALAQHVAMRLPAHARLELGRHYLALGELVADEKNRPRNQHHKRHPQQEARVIGKERRRVADPLEQVDEISDELGERHLGQGREQVEDQHHQKPGQDRLNEMPVERPQRPGRMRGRRALERIDARFEPAEHLASPSLPAVCRAPATSAARGKINVGSTPRRGASKLHGAICRILSRPSAGSVW